MNTLNHLATGTIIALLIDKPLIAVPLAFLSHFALDAVPHFGFNAGSESGYAEALEHKWLSTPPLVLDIFGTGILVWLIRGQPWYVFAAAVAAIVPDLKWPYRYFKFERKGIKPPKPDAITQFHLKIQWAERPWGLVIEIPYALAALFMVSRLT